MRKATAGRPSHSVPSVRANYETASETFMAEHLFATCEESDESPAAVITSEIWVNDCADSAPAPVIRIINGLKLYWTG